METITTVNEHNFHSEVTQAAKPVLLEFWAEWCDPCDRLSPVLDNIAEKYDGEIKLVKSHVNDNENLAMKYNVDVIPTLLFFKDGQVVEQLAGYMSVPELSFRVNKVLKSSV